MQLLGATVLIVAMIVLAVASVAYTARVQQYVLRAYDRLRSRSRVVARLLPYAFVKGDRYPLLIRVVGVGALALALLTVLSIR